MAVEPVRRGLSVFFNGFSLPLGFRQEKLLSL
jgi:hypothetical protein